MESLQKTRIEIIDWIAGLYNSNNRSTDGLHCSYNGPNGTHCAFAMMCVDPISLREICDGGEGPETIAEFKPELIKPELIKPEFRGHPPVFYAVIQLLHDRESNWNTSGLTESGRKKVETLKEAWA